MLQLRRKLTNLMELQYGGKDGIVDEVNNERDEKMLRFVNL